MKKFGESGLDSTGQHNHLPVDEVTPISNTHKRKVVVRKRNNRKIYTKRFRKVATLFKAFSILLALNYASSKKIKKKMKKLETKIKREAIETKRVEEITKSNAEEIVKLQNHCKELNEKINGVALGYDDQNDRMEEAENQLTNIVMRDVIRLLMESDVRGTTPRTNAFQ
ncbi:hypothetical protein ACFE04_029228 [Oxalis oulophora]